MVILKKLIQMLLGKMITSVAVTIAKTFKYLMSNIEGLKFSKVDVFAKTNFNYHKY